MPNFLTKLFDLLEGRRVKGCMRYYAQQCHTQATLVYDS